MKNKFTQEEYFFFQRYWQYPQKARHRTEAKKSGAVFLKQMLFSFLREKK